jgi:membrane fusion protein (multidrug efflux system)
VTQRVPVKISLDPSEITSNPLRLGISMRVKVDTRERGGEVLRDDVSNDDLYSTAVFENELKNADALVDTVITENEDPHIAPAISSASR